MQLRGGESFKKRAQFIISKAYSSQDISGKEFISLQKCYLICIINFELFKTPGGLAMDYRFRDKNGKDLTDDQTILFIQLPEADKILAKPVEAMTALEMWAVFFRHVSDKSKRDKLEAIMKRKEEIGMAASVLYEISQDEKTRIQYENELIAELDVRSWISDAREEGLTIGEERGIAIGVETTLLIVNALKAQIPVDEIAAKYSLPLEQIERIQSTVGL